MPDRDKVVDATEYLGKLGFAIGRSRLERMKIVLVFAADYLLLESERCWRLGLAVNELLTNSARHACFDTRDGEIWRRAKARRNPRQLQGLGQWIEHDEGETGARLANR